MRLLRCARNDNEHEGLLRHYVPRNDKVDVIARSKAKQLKPVLSCEECNDEAI